MCSCVTFASHNCTQVLSKLTKNFAVLGMTATNIIAKSTNTTIKMHVDTNDGGLRQFAVPGFHVVLGAGPKCVPCTWRLFAAWVLLSRC